MQTFDSHVSEIVKACNFHLNALRHLRRSLTRDVANTLACSIVSTRKYYCNALLHDTVVKGLARIHCV